MKRDAILKILLPLGFIFIFFLLWEMSSRYGLINAALFSQPSSIFSAIIRGDILSNVVASLVRLCIGVLGGYTLGVVIGFLMLESRHLDIVDDIIAFLASIPGISWAPIFLLTVGFGNYTIIGVAILSAFFPAVYNVLQGAKEIRRNHCNLARLFGYSRVQTIFLVKIPSLMTYLINGFKLALVRAWRVIIAVEMIAGALTGIGFMIFDARELLNMKVMFLGILLSGILFYIIERTTIILLEKLTIIKWGMKIDQV